MSYEEAHNAQKEPLIEGEDYYFEDGLMVLTGRYLLRRGYCCEQGCRHCPYGFTDEHHKLPAPDHLPH